MKEINQNDNEPQRNILSKVLVVLIIAVVAFIGFKSMNFSGKAKTIPAIEKAQNIPLEEKINPQPMMTADTMNASLTTEDVKIIISQYLNDNPEVVMDALRKLEAKAVAEKTKSAEDFVRNNADKFIADKPYIGNKDGNLVVIKFFDYRCGYCKRSHITLERIVKEYPNVKVVLENTPILGEKSMLASKASIAFWSLSPKNFDKLHSELMNLDISEASIEALAKKYGIAKAPLFDMMNSTKVQDKINENIKLAQQAGVQGVPAFIVNGKFIPGSMNYEEFKAKLDEEQKALSEVKK